MLKIFFKKIKEEFAKLYSQINEFNKKVFNKHFFNKTFNIALLVCGITITTLSSFGMAFTKTAQEETICNEIFNEIDSINSMLSFKNDIEDKISIQEYNKLVRDEFFSSRIKTRLSISEKQNQNVKLNLKFNNELIDDTKISLVNLQTVATASHNPLYMANDDLYLYQKRSQNLVAPGARSWVYISDVLANKLQPESKNDDYSSFISEKNNISVEIKTNGALSTYNFTITNVYHSDNESSNYLRDVYGEPIIMWYFNNNFTNTVFNDLHLDVDVKNNKMLINKIFDFNKKNNYSNNVSISSSKTSYVPNECYYQKYLNETSDNNLAHILFMSFTILFAVLFTILLFYKYSSKTLNEYQKIPAIIILFLVSYSIHMLFNSLLSIFFDNLIFSSLLSSIALLISLLSLLFPFFIFIIRNLLCHKKN